MRRQGRSRNGAFTLHAEGAQRGQGGFDAYLSAWEDELGGPYRHPKYSTSTAEQFSGTFENVVLGDIVIASYQATSRIRTAEVDDLEQDQIRLYVVNRGALHLDDPLGQGDVRLGPGSFLLGHVAHEYHFDTTSPIAALNVFLPGDLLRDLLSGRPLTGSADSAPVRMLVAHAGMIQKNLPHLGRAGKESAGAALVELAKGLALDGFDDQEPSFVPALVQAARDLAEEFLEEPDLSPELIAKYLHVSVRTLQRSFAVASEPLSAYIRRRRLEEATRMLLAPRPVSISEVAASWFFTDSSHFVRAFKKQQGLTPSEFTRLRGSRE